MNKFSNLLKEPFPSFTYAIAYTGVVVHKAVNRT